MILPIAFAKLARGGAATVAIVPVGRERQVQRKNGTSYQSTPWRPSTGRHEALLSKSGRTTAKVANIVLGAHQDLLLVDLLDDTPEMLMLVRRAGCKTRAVFADLWMRHYDRAWPILTEELCPACGGHKIVEETGLECDQCDPVGVILMEEPRTDAEILDRFRRRHGRKPVHVVHFELDHDDTRYLSPAARHRGDDLGYVTTTDLIDAGAAVPLQFQVDLSRKAFEADDERRREQIENGELRGLRVSESRHERARERAAEKHRLEVEARRAADAA